jgi:hypothetical protein
MTIKHASSGWVQVRQVIFDLFLQTRHPEPPQTHTHVESTVLAI